LQLPTTLADGSPEVDVRKVLSSILMVLAVVIALVIVMILVASAVTNEGASKVATEGKIAIQAEGSLSSASAVRNASINARLIAQGVAAEPPLYELPVLDDATNILSKYAAEFATRATQLADGLDGAERATVVEATDAYFLGIETVIADLDGYVAAIEAGQDVTVGDDPTGDAYVAAVTELRKVRDERAVSVLAESEYSGIAADAVRFLVVFVIPVTAMVLLRSVVRRRRERELLQAELARQHAVIVSKDEFVTNLSHELRTPLTGVYSTALILAESGFADREIAGELTGLIINDAGELSRMVDDLITAGQIETDSVALTFEDLEIDPEVRTVIDPFIHAGASITFTPSGDSAEIDRLRFRQVLRNLVSNAVKHGGPNIEVFSEYGAGMVSIFVMDDGDGIPDEHVSGLFDRYQHEGTEPLLQGSVGLGLAVARALAVGMGGSLTYTRTNGITYFVFKVPSHRVGRLNERVEDQSLGNEGAAKSASEVAKLFAR
jgi:signal transduction histidine kinase